MSTDLARPEDVSSALYHYLGTGDLSNLPPHQRAALYLDVCRSLGINPRTRPLDWIEFEEWPSKVKKLTLYPNKSCTDQLAYQHRIRVEILEEKIVGTLFKVVVKGTMPSGRSEQNVAYVDLTDSQGNQLRGQRLGNAYMKATTKAKRRLILGMVGLMSPPDLEDLRQPKVVTVDGDGNVIDHPTEEQRHLAAHPAVAAAIGEPTFEDHADELDSAAVNVPDQEPDRTGWEAPKRTGPRPSFRASDEDVQRWQGAWFAAVKGLSLDSDDERHRFVRQYTATAGWPEGKQTDSLPTMLARMTEREAADLLAHVRAVCEGEKAALLDHAAAASNELEKPEPFDDEDAEPF